MTYRALTLLLSLAATTAHGVPGPWRRTEARQLAFVGAVLTAGALVGRWLPMRSTRLAVYAMGILSAFWCFERIGAWLG